MGAGVTAGMVARLERDRPLLAGVGPADRVAALLRDNIMEGVFPPGTRLSEEAIGQVIGVSRNTLREAFRLLCHERAAAEEELLSYLESSEQQLLAAYRARSG